MNCLLHVCPTHQTAQDCTVGRGTAAARIRAARDDPGARSDGRDAVPGRPEWIPEPPKDRMRACSVPLPRSRKKEVRMPRRIILFCLLAAFVQLGSGCYCVRQRIAYRWHYFHGNCVGCTPAFRVPPPVGPVYSGPAVGCPSCYTPPDVGPVVPVGPVAFSGPPIPPPVGPAGGVPMITSPMPILPGPTVEPGIPNTMPQPKPSH